MVQTAAPKKQCSSGSVGSSSISSNVGFGQSSLDGSGSSSLAALRSY